MTKKRHRRTRRRRRPRDFVFATRVAVKDARTPPVDARHLARALALDALSSRRERTRERRSVLRSIAVARCQPRPRSVHLPRSPPRASSGPRRTRPASPSLALPVRPLLRSVIARRPRAAIAALATTRAPRDRARRRIAAGSVCLINSRAPRARGRPSRRRGVSRRRSL